MVAEGVDKSGVADIDVGSGAIEGHGRVGVANQQASDALGDGAVQRARVGADTVGRCHARVVQSPVGGRPVAADQRRVGGRRYGGVIGKSCYVQIAVQGRVYV